MGENPYGDLLCQYFLKQFPQLNLSKGNLLEIISQLIIGTKDIRYGAIPAPEFSVVIRKVIADALENEEPIPVLVPWGGIKANMNEPIDVAEIAGLNQLVTVNNLIKQYYPPGLRINIRIEDTGALWLYKNDENVVSLATADAVASYSNDFSLLTKILAGDFINPVLESTKMNLGEYFTTSQRYSEKLFEYMKSGLMGSGKHYDDLNTLGWKGVIPTEQREHYTKRYEVLYPNETPSKHLRRLADYLGGAKARYDLNGRAEPAEKFIQITFVQPIPGAPASLFNNTLYYRAVPLKESRSHISPWRAKGYLEINGNEISTKITSFNNTNIIEQLIPGVIEVSNDDYKVSVQTDYTLTN